MEDDNKIIDFDEIEIHGTIFTIYSCESTHAKKDAKKLLEGLILNNIDSIKSA